MKKILCYLSSVSILYAAMATSGMRLVEFYDVVSLLLMGVLGILAWLNWGSLERTNNMTLQWMKKDKMLRVFWRYQVTGASVAWLVALILVLADQGENMATIGQSLALLLISAIYLLLLKMMVIHPQQVEIQKQLIHLGRE